MKIDYSGTHRTFDVYSKAGMDSSISPEYRFHPLVSPEPTPGLSVSWAERYRSDKNVDDVSGLARRKAEKPHIALTAALIAIMTDPEQSRIRGFRLLCARAATRAAEQYEDFYSILERRNSSLAFAW